METLTILLIIFSIIGIVVSYAVSFLLDHLYLPSLFKEKIKNPLMNESRGMKMMVPLILYWLIIWVLILLF
jgi:hypothetical protein